MDYFVRFQGWKGPRLSPFVDTSVARNRRLEAEIAVELQAAAADSQTSGQAARHFKGFTWTTRKSWSQPGRVVGKAEHPPKGSNPASS